MRSSSGWIFVDDRCWTWANLSCDRCTACAKLYFHQGCPVNWIYTFVCSSWFRRTFSITSWSVFLSFHPTPFSHRGKVVAVRLSSWPRSVPAYQRSCHHVRSRRPWQTCATSPPSIDTTKTCRLFDRGGRRHGGTHLHFVRLVRVRKGNLDWEKGP